MSDGWSTSISVGIHRDCPMEFRVQYRGVVEFWTCRGDEELDLSFDLDALRRFLELGTAAVAKAEALVAAERTRAVAGRGVNDGQPAALPPGNVRMSTSTSAPE